MTTLDTLCRIAEVKFAGIVAQTDFLGAKLRVMLTDGFAAERKPKNDT